MERATRLRVLYIIFVLIAFISGCGTTSTGGTRSLQPNILHVIRVTSPFIQVKNLDITINDAKKVEEVYKAIQALPSVPDRKTVRCPLDQEVDYHLSFSQGDIEINQAVFHPQRCPWIKLDDGIMRRSSDDFLALLATVLRVTPEELHGPFSSSSNASLANTRYMLHWG